MPLFRRGAGPDQEAARAAQAEQQASVEALARGGLPARAAERLQVAEGVFTSSFSVDEFALAGLEGFRPVAQVMTRRVTMAPPDADLLWAADTMRRLGVRHLPVGEGGLVAGIVSIRDLFAAAEAVLRLDPRGADAARDMLSAAGA